MNVKSYMFFIKAVIFSLCVNVFLSPNVMAADLAVPQTIIEDASGKLKQHMQDPGF